MSLKGETNVVISTGTIIKAILVILAFVLFYILRDIVLILLTSVVIASAIDPAARWFGKFKIPRAFAVVIIYIVVALVFAGIIFYFVPPLVGEISGVARNLPQYIESFKLPSFLDFGDGTTSTLFPDSLATSFSLEGAVSSIQKTLAGVSRGFLQTLSIIFGGAMSFILIVVISFYLAVQEKGIENFLRVITPQPHEKYVLDLWQRSKIKIGQWLKGQLLLGFLIGVLVYLGLMILRVEHALLLAVLAGVLELIPFFGPVIAAVPAVLFGFSSSPLLGFMVLGLYIIIQQFENHLIYPLVVTKIVGVPPMLVIIALIVGGQLAGFLGIILAVPIATVLMELFHDAEKKKFLKAGVAGK